MFANLTDKTYSKIKLNKQGPRRGGGLGEEGESCFKAVLKGVKNLGPLLS